MRELLTVYLCGVILLLGISTTIDSEDVSLGHILIAGFGWPILTPIMALRVWTGR